jgi:hypothetical protein
MQAYNKDLRNFYYYSLHIIMVLKSGTVRWNGLLARVGKTRRAYKILVGTLKRKDHSGVLAVDTKIILKWALNNGVWTESNWSKIWTNGGLL